MRLSRAPHRALLLCAAATVLAACSASGSADRSAGAPGAGGASSTVTTDPRRSVVTFTGETALGAEAVRRTADRMRARVKALGLKDVRVEGRGGEITVTGRSADVKALMELGVSGRISFRPVLAEEAVGVTRTPPPSPSADPPSGRAVTEGLRPHTDGSPSASAGPAQTEGGAQSAALQARFAALNCSANERAELGRRATAGDSVLACGTDGGGSGSRAKFVLGPTAVDGVHLSSARAVHDRQAGGWIVRLGFDSVGARQFSALTQGLSVNAPPQNQMAIVLDGGVISAPSVHQRLEGGTADIYGGYDRRTAEQLAVTVGTGPLPARVQIASVTQLPHE
ncbi:SecDF P1 head subdomain-containing protein [Streptomyces aureus]